MHNAGLGLQPGRQAGGRAGGLRKLAMLGIWVSLRPGNPPILYVLLLLLLLLRPCRYLSEDEGIRSEGEDPMEADSGGGSLHSV